MLIFVIAAAAIGTTLLSADGLARLVGLRGIFVAHGKVEFSRWATQTAASIAIFIGLSHLVRMLGRLSTREVFSPFLGEHLRGFARWMFIGFALQLCLPFLLSGIGRLLGHSRHFVIELSSGDLLLLIASAMLYEIGGLLDFGHRVESDHRQIV